MNAPVLRFRVLPAVPPIDARNIELRSHEGNVEWRLIGDEDWQFLFPLSDIVGPAGPPIELRVNDDEVQWRVQGSDDAWNTLTSLSAFVAAVEDAALLAQAWAEGSQPGGPGTRSSREWSQESESFSDLSQAWATGTNPDGLGSLSAREEADRAKAEADRAEEAADSVEFPVSYAPQALSDEEQQQARANIGLDVGYRHVTTLAFTASDTFEKGDYPWARRIRVRIQAPGGGSGHAGTSTSGQGAESGGGGAGQYREAWFDPDDLDASESVTIGAAGPGGTNGNNGTNGGDSSFAGMIAQGGRGGDAASSSSNAGAFGGLVANGGAYGAKALTDGRLAVPGEGGRHGRIVGGVSVTGNNGGKSHMGAGGQATLASAQPGEPGIQGGGGGGSRTVNSSAQPGAAGGGSTIWIDLFA